ncbi:MAG: hypothetical protein JXA69_07760 [Phycisphaerae bacterium]|nr:hypothetical protein [Phycisphaerae bacterium]
MTKPKTFDCVAMKSEIQQKLQAEFPDMPEMEKRRMQLDRVRHNPVLGSLMENVRIVQLNRRSGGE